MVNEHERIEEVVTIDGPAGAGKSTVAYRLATELNYAYLDTGAMYRAATWWALDQGTDFSDHGALAQATISMPLNMVATKTGLAIVVDGRDVSKLIRTRDVTERIRQLDTVRQVRENLVSRQREFAHRGPTVAEGRDMGTVVFPHARCKFYLEADLKTRAERRAIQLAQQGNEVDTDTILHDIQVRDESDMTRTVAPLRPAKDAIVIDSSSMSIDEVVETLLRKVRSIL